MRKDKVIEPSEIIVDQPRITKEDTSHVNPWIRFLARMIDYSFFGVILSFFPKVYSFHFTMVPLLYLLWVPIEAVLLSSWGYTPGKFLLKTKLSYKRHRLSLPTSMRRAFLVWFRGFGMGIPFVNLITMLVAYSHLKSAKLTTWDRDEKILITHRPIATLRIALSVGLLVVMNFFREYTVR
ncbi:MAG: RDD family protein [Chlamydiota bacterium]|jgi:hypothetical protein